MTTSWSRRPAPKHYEPKPNDSHETAVARGKREERKMVSARTVSLVLALGLGLLAAAGMMAVAQPNDRSQRPQPPPDSDEQRIADLVLASRILVNEGVLDSFGHVTVRSLKNPTHYFMPRAMPPALVTASDIVELDADSAPIDPRAPRTNGERFIHGEIYRVRPDVQAVVHSHSLSVIPFSITPDRPLRPVLHMAGFLPEKVSVFDHRSVSKDDPSVRGKLMVNNAKLGAALAQKLGGDSVVLIRGHGNAVVGASAPWAVLRAVYTQLNARAELEALSLGHEVIYLNEDELKQHPVEVFDVGRPWDNFKARLPKNP
jgi:HCOMODA/2-hydroxy-3-carboxy-muconic semialdehyde decarboxylase